MMTSKSFEAITINVDGTGRGAVLRSYPHHNPHLSFGRLTMEGHRTEYMATFWKVLTPGRRSVRILAGHPCRDGGWWSDIDADHVGINHTGNCDDLGRTAMRTMTRRVKVDIQYVL